MTVFGERIDASAIAALAIVGVCAVGVLHGAARAVTYLADARWADSYINWTAVGGLGLMFAILLTAGFVDMVRGRIYTE